MITHFDEDHSAGVVTLLESRPCGGLMFRVNVGRRTPTDMAQHRRILARKKRGLNCPGAVCGAGYSLSDDSDSRVHWMVLSPTLETELSAYASNSRNRASLVLRIEIRPAETSGHTRYVLVAGDADAFVWRDLLSRADLACDVLLWPHHGGVIGSAVSSIASQVLQACAAELVVISAGSRNSYGHPAMATLSAIRNSSARLICTEVTRRCDSLSATNAEQPCGGDIVFVVTPSGETRVTPSEQDHGTVVAGWDRPQCLPGPGLEVPTTVVRQRTQERADVGLPPSTEQTVE